MAETARRAGRVRSGPAKQTSWLAKERTEFLIGAYGGVTKLARTLGVSASQPSRWREGSERPGLETAKRLLDLDHVIARALLLWAPDVAVTWLESPNAFLDHARPIDVVLSRGTGEVLDALDAALSGAYA